MPSDAETPHPDMPGWRSLFFRSGDGAAPAHCRNGRSPLAAPAGDLPAGLTRNAMDFDLVGSRIAREQGRRVLAFDYRGRASPITTATGRNTT